MHENWGFAMTRESWLAQRTLREEYWSIVDRCDYQFRDQAAIHKLYRKYGCKCEYTSQDSSRWVAAHLQKMVRLTTATCHARYIGAVGFHSTQEHYNRHNFDKFVINPNRPSLRTPSDEEIEAWYQADRKLFELGYQHSYVSAH